MDKRIIVIVVGFVIAILAGGMFLAMRQPEQKVIPGMEEFAKCIAAKNLTMYGAYWCPHCKNQKALFGIDFKHVPYVECTVETKKCLDNKIDGYPTWIDSTGNRYEGELSLQKLSEITQCKLPESK